MTFSPTEALLAYGRSVLSDDEFNALLDDQIEGVLSELGELTGQEDLMPSIRMVYRRPDGGYVFGLVVCPLPLDAQRYKRYFLLGYHLAETADPDNTLVAAYLTSCAWVTNGDQERAEVAIVSGYGVDLQRRNAFVARYHRDSSGRPIVGEQFTCHHGGEEPAVKVTSNRLLYFFLHGFACGSLQRSLETCETFLGHAGELA